MLKEYLKKSAVAESVCLETNVILERQKTSAGKIGEIQKNGRFTHKLENHSEYELEVNGLIVAKGKIVRKGGEYFFKVVEINKEAEL